MIHTKRTYLMILALLVGISCGFTDCPKEQKIAFKRQAVNQTDRLANSLKFSQGVVEDLYTHDKISKTSAREATEKILEANKVAKKIGEKVKAIDPNATVLPADIAGLLEELDGILKGFGINQSEFIKSIADAVAIVRDLRRLL